MGDITHIVGENIQDCISYMLDENLADKILKVFYAIKYFIMCFFNCFMSNSIRKHTYKWRSTFHCWSSHMHLYGIFIDRATDM